MATKADQQLRANRKWIRQALAELAQARAYMSRDYIGPQFECLDWAQRFLENALEGKKHGST